MNCFMQRSNYLIFIISLVVVSLFLEVGLRWLTPYPINRHSNKVKHKELSFVLNPNLKEVDKDGFRNEDNLKNIKIVAIGDSHTYGANVSSVKSWPKGVRHKVK